MARVNTHYNEAMKKFAVFGYPIAHSLSPQIHQGFAEPLNIEISYTKIDPGPDGFVDAVKAFQAAGAFGANVTSPFKEEAYQLCDSLSPRAKSAQSVNTLSFQKDGAISGDNTDGIGLATDIQKNCSYTLSGKRILVLGAGGAARGIIPALLDTVPASLTVTNRTPSKAAVIATQFPGIVTCGLNELKHHLFDVIINATNANPTLPPDILSTESLCYDLNYTKNTTAFLKWAKENNAGLCKNGYGMLVEQAAEAFNLWHGVRLAYLHKSKNLL